MNRRNLILLGFAVAIAAQLAVPAWLIFKHERTLSTGKVFKFKTQPVDPVDAFRGRYVWLSLEQGTVKVPDASQWHYDQKAYAVLGTDSNGYAIVKRLDLDPPADEPAIRIRSMWSDAKEGTVHINWQGLDRFYMTESKAPAAETAYRQHSLRTNQTCHVTVRVRGTHAVIENLFIDDQPIGEWLRQNAKK